MGVEKKHLDVWLDGIEQAGIPRELGIKLQAKIAASYRPEDRSSLTDSQKRVIGEAVLCAAFEVSEMMLSSDDLAKILSENPTSWIVNYDREQVLKERLVAVIAGKISGMQKASASIEECRQETIRQGRAIDALCQRLIHILDAPTFLPNHKEVKIDQLDLAKDASASLVRSAIEAWEKVLVQMFNHGLWIPKWNSFIGKDLTFEETAVWFQEIDVLIQNLVKKDTAEGGILNDAWEKAWRSLDRGVKEILRKELRWIPVLKG